uniref:Uncharacterized protein n=1 Tax=Vannella robusta TaxID=1487602 RepID=A0A7S4M8X4_9EUKA
MLLIMIITTLMLLVFGIAYLCTVEEIDSVKNYQRSVCFDKATKDLCSGVDSMYFGALVVYSVATLVWAVSDLFVGVMFFISYQKLSKSQYGLDLPFAQSQP